MGTQVADPRWGGWGWFRHSTDREIALMVLMAYLSYLLAEVRGVMGGCGTGGSWYDVIIAWVHGGPGSGGVLGFKIQNK